MDVFAPIGSGVLQIQSNIGAPSIKGVHVNALQVQQCWGHLVFNLCNSCITKMLTKPLVHAKIRTTCRKNRLSVKAEEIMGRVCAWGMRAHMEEVCEIRF